MAKMAPDWEQACVTAQSELRKAYEAAYQRKPFGEILLVGKTHGPDGPGKVQAKIIEELKPVSP